MTICLITSFAPVRVGSALGRGPLAVVHITPVRRSLSFARDLVRLEKAGIFEIFTEDTRFLAVSFTGVKTPTSEGRRQAYQTY